MSYIGSGGFPCSRTLMCMQLFANTLKEQLVDCTRAYKEGYPGSLLKLSQMGTQGVHMKGVVPWLVRWARRAATRYFCPALVALVGLVQIFSSPYTISLHLFPLPSKLGIQPCQVTPCLLVCACGLHRSECILLRGSQQNAFLWGVGEQGIVV
jgi:hypothetical protein